MTPRQEAEILVGILHENFSSGKWIDGKESILEMKAAQTRTWKETEWPTFYIKYILEAYCLQNPECGMVPYREIKKSTR